MNAIDAIIALCAISAGLALLLAAVNETKKESQEAIDSISAKSNALKCAGIIDSFISNSANEYNGEIKCETNGNFVSSSVNLKTKIAAIIGKAEKKMTIEISAPKHYYE